jgi:CDP-glycerol glycerophosphotransferase
MLWAVGDSSATVPEGARPVLLRSREWYDALARAAWVVTNIELDPWFTRWDGQQVLETYHGYPSKAMGLAQWRARGLTPTHVEQMLRRTSGSWNNLLTPIPEMDRYYRENYRFEGRIISRGYPRHDALVAPDRDAHRAATRARLGIAEHQKAVLYAPTWRDDLATNFRSAHAVSHLSVDQAASALGPDYLLLMRGHRFHATSEHGARVLDVTAYPEINDLILASDAAILDYSSLRFDFALTGHPMVFLVPDLEHYTERTRGFLYDFADSAPGPFVDTTEQVVEALADLPALEQAWAPRIAEFNARFNRLADGRASERVVAEFFGPLLAPGRRVDTG